MFSGFSQKIISAIRKDGGRFLELDECTGVYTDIDDKTVSKNESRQHELNPSAGAFEAKLWRFSSKGLKELGPMRCLIFPSA